MIRHATSAIALCLTTTLLTSCAASNYDFDRVTEPRGDARAAALEDDLLEERVNDDDDALYDLDYVPLAHLDVHVFAASDGEDDYPPGHVEVDLEAYLPLAMLVDVTVDRYDEDRALYEHLDVFALLWGVFASHHEEILTPRGVRSESSYRLLWFIGWGTGPEYADVDV